jgi:hypothetical protein
VSDPLSSIKATWQALRQAAAAQPPAAPRPPALPLSVSRPVLGELRGSSDALEGTLRLGDAQAALSVARDADELEPTLTFAEQVVGDLTRVRELSAQAVADAFHALYNSDWRMGETLNADGSTAPFEHPALSREEFIARLTLTDVAIAGTSSATLSFDCGDMFWGHHFAVTSFDGLAFGDPYAQMLG